MTLHTWTTFLFIAAAPVVSGGNYFPLEEGNLWSYRDSVSGQVLEIKVGPQQALNGRNYFAVDGFAPQTLAMRLDEAGNLVAFVIDRGIELPVVEFKAGAQFETYGRQCAASGRTGEQPGKQSGPAGAWEVVEVRYQVRGCADVGDVAEHFADNIGMVHREVVTFAGPRNLDLIYARVGRQVISTDSTGAFRVTAAEGRDRSSWDVTLRVELDKAMSLDFYSGQEFDLRLRDAAGQTVWTWSADKLFIQAVHTIPDLRGWSATVSVPHPPAIPERDSYWYVLEAWLTPSQDQPRFAAATVLSKGTITVGQVSEEAPRRR